MQELRKLSWLMVMAYLVIGDVKLVRAQTQPNPSPTNVSQTPTVPATPKQKKSALAGSASQINIITPETDATVTTQLSDADVSWLLSHLGDLDSTGAIGANDSDASSATAASAGVKQTAKKTKSQIAKVASVAT